MTAVIIGALALIAVCGAALYAIVKRRKRLHYQVERIRSSDLYAHLYPALMRCNNRCVESIAVHRDRLTVHLYKPAGGRLVYTFDKHGFDPLGEEYLYALAQAIAVDLPLLQDTTRYTFHTRPTTLPNGKKAKWYEYMITTDYKDSMIRAEYLGKKPQRV